jgi:hypothetical protein
VLLWVIGMRIGIGLPNPVPDCSGRLLLEWAVTAERRDFSSVGDNRPYCVSELRVNHRRWPLLPR